MNELEERVRSLVEPVLAKHGAELVDLQLKRGPTQLVRIVADTEQGIDLETCARVSDEVGRLLDIDDPIVGPYTLEVTSPGLDRPLRTAEDFLRMRGRTVKVVLTDGRHKEGVVEEVGENSVTLRAGATGAKAHPARRALGEQVEVPFEEIDRATLVLPW